MLRSGVRAPLSPPPHTPAPDFRFPISESMAEPFRRVRRLTRSGGVRAAPGGGMLRWVAVFGVALSLAIAPSHLGAARAEGVSVAVTPASGACSDAITVHVSGIEPNPYTYLFIASAGERSNPDRVLMISFFSDTTL